MKFEDLLMQQSEERQKRINLEQEVEELKAELDGEIKLGRMLQFALDGPIRSCPWLPSPLPFQIQVILAEIAKVEEEIMWLERKVDELSLSLYQEKKQTRELELQQLKDLYLTVEYGRHTPLVGRHKKQAELKNYELQYYDTRKNYRITRGKRSSSSSVDIQSIFPSRSNGNDDYDSGIEDMTAYSRCLQRSQSHIYLDAAISFENPNKLSEDLIKCLIGIFLNMNQSLLDNEESAIIPKQTISCMNSKSFISKSTFNCTAPAFSSDDNSPFLDPYGILLDLDGNIRDIGPYKNLIQITRNSLDQNRITECSQAVGELRTLIHKLCYVDIKHLTYKQKLAFWINIYNACIMHAFLRHGFPSTQEKLLVLMNKAAINVGGIVLNALAIEHFILRHPTSCNHGPTDEKELLLRHAYGLGYPEPNVTFALCRGSWSSPALRVYTADDIVNELGRARLEYLEASVGITSKKKIIVPKLLQWHIRDFADDMESLLEWIYSQLPQSGSVKRLIMECLNNNAKPNPRKMIEIQPYVSGFRYLLPS